MEWGRRRFVHRHRLQDNRILLLKAPQPLELGGGFRTGVYLDVPRDTLYSLTIFRKGGNKSFAWGDADDSEETGGAMTELPFNGEQKTKIATRNAGLRHRESPQRPALCERLGFAACWSSIRFAPHDRTTFLSASIRINWPSASHRTIGCSSPVRRAITCLVIDTSPGTVQETIFTAVFPKSPGGKHARCI